MAMECCDKIFKKNIKVSNTENFHYGTIVMFRCQLMIIFSYHITGQNLRKIMWNYVGIIRSDKMLTYAKERLDVIHSEINEFYHNHHINMDLLELRNLIDVANIITTSRFERKESRGLHFNKDYPHMDERFNQANKAY